MLMGTNETNNYFHRPDDLNNGSAPGFYKPEGMGGNNRNDNSSPEVKKPKVNPDFFAVKKRDIVIIAVILILILGAGSFALYDSYRIRKEEAGTIDDISEMYSVGNYEGVSMLCEEMINNRAESTDKGIETAQSYRALVDGRNALELHDYDTACSILENMSLEDSDELYLKSKENKQIMDAINTFDYERALSLIDSTTHLTGSEIKGYKDRIHYDSQAFSAIWCWCVANDIVYDYLRMKQILWVTDYVTLDEETFFADKEQPMVIFEYGNQKSDNTFIGVVAYIDGKFTVFGDEAKPQGEIAGLYDDYTYKTRNLEVTLKAKKYLSVETIATSLGSDQLYTWLPEDGKQGMVENLDEYNSMLDEGKIEPINTTY